MSSFSIIPRGVVDTASLAASLGECCSSYTIMIEVASTPVVVVEGDNLNVFKMNALFSANPYPPAILPGYRHHNYRHAFEIEGNLEEMQNVLENIAFLFRRVREEPIALKLSVRKEEGTIVRRRGIFVRCSLLLDTLQTELGDIEAIFSERKSVSKGRGSAADMDALKELLSPFADFPFYSSDTERIRVDGVKLLNGRGSALMPVTVVERGAMIFGSPGTGKSSLIAKLVRAAAGRTAILLIDPHGELARNIRDTVPNAIYLNPINAKIGMNVLQSLRCVSNESSYSMMASFVVEALKNIFGEEFWGPRSEYVLGGILHALKELEGANLVDAVELLDNPAACASLAAITSDEITKKFLIEELPRFREEWLMPLRDKLGRLVMEDSIRSFICRRSANVDLKDVTERQGILVIDADFSILGTEGSIFLSALALTAFWMAASASRKKCLIVIDEAHLFSQDLIATIASQGRKFGVGLIAASQSPSFFDARKLNILLTNFNHLFLFRLSAGDAHMLESVVPEESRCMMNVLKNMNCIHVNWKGTELLQIEAESSDHRLEVNKRSDDDSLPSILSQLESKLLHTLQIVDMAQEVDLLEREDLLKKMVTDRSSFSNELSAARSYGLVHQRSFKLTKKGERELRRLQGGHKCWKGTAQRGCYQDCTGAWQTGGKDNHNETAAWRDATGHHSKG